MIFKLEYKNKDLDVARLEIITPGLVEKTIEGTEDPFRLIYKLDKPYKSGHFLTSSAEINIYETPDFNIDRLKTSNETEIKVDYYINNIKKWTGFVIPDFFSKEIGKRSVVSMVASDRIGTLKGVTLTDLNAFVSLRTLAEQCLLKTGLSLPLKTMVDLESDAVNFFNTDALSQRLVDNKGRSISCYDVLSSILVASDSIILQRNAEWYIVNKLQHELGQGKLYSDSTTFTNWQDIIHNFSDVNVGARRTIIPVAASTGVYHEHGGGMLHPDNYDFSKGVSGWASKNGFSYTISNQKPVSYSVGTPNHTVTFGESDRNRMMIMGVVNPFWKPDTAPHVENKFPVITSNENSVKITIDISVLGWGYWGAFSTGRFIILAENGSSRLAFNPNSGSFEEFNNEATSSNSSEPPYVIKLKPSANKVGDTYPVTNKSVKYETVLETANLSDYTISIRIYGTSGFTGPTAPLFINFANIKFSNTEEAPKGTIFKTEQGSNFTKEHEIETSIWGDYLYSGLNGYFYNYPIDDTSSLYSNGVLTSKWTDITDPGVERSLLHHITTQRSRMFSQAHDLVSAEMDIRLFDPLSIYVACSKRYTLVSATVDFLRGRANLEIEEAVYKNLTKRDFIYSYFGDGESGIKSIGGISGGAGGSTGGGLTPEQLEILSFWKKDPDNPDTIFTEMNAYSKLELSAYGVGNGGGGGGDGIIETVYGYSNLGQTFNDSVLNDTFNAYTINQINTRLEAVEAGGGGGAYMLDSWANYTTEKANFYVPASLLVPFRNDTLSRLEAVEAGGGSSPSQYWTLDEDGNLKTEYNVYSTKGVSAYGLGTDGGGGGGDYNRLDVWADYDSTKAGWVLSAFLGNDLNTRVTALQQSAPTTAKQSEWDIAFANTHTHSNKTQLDLITQSNIDVLAKLSIVNGNLQIDGNAYATGELSAYGVGDGGGGGGGIIETVYGYSNLGQTFNNNVLTDTFNAYTINQINTRLLSVEGGSATTVNTTGTGNAITSISKSGTVITANKGSTFSLSTHNHDTLYKPIGYAPTWGEVTGKPSTFAPSAHNHPISDITGLQTALNSKLETSIFNTHNTDNIRHITGAERTKWDGVVTDFATHIANKSNPHGVTKAQVGLSNVDNTADVNKNVLSATKLTEINSYDANDVVGGASFNYGSASYWINAPTGMSYGGIGNVISRGSNSLSLQLAFDINHNSESSTKDLWFRSGNNLGFQNDWKKVWHSGNLTSLSQLTDNIGVATHIANKANPHAVTKAQVGLGNVDNTSDVNKPVSTAMQTALNLKANLASPTFTGSVTAPAFIGALSGNAYSATTANRLNRLGDNRGSFKPSQVPAGSLIATFSTQGALVNQVNDSDYSDVIAISTYSDSSGGRVNALSFDKSSYRINHFTGTYGASTWSGFKTLAYLTDNVASATKLQTARTIWGQSFDGTGNVSGSLSGVTTLAMTGAISGATTITASTSVTTPKVIFNSAGWSMEQVGSELQLKHNNVLKMRFTSTGSIVAVDEITAFG